MKKQRTWEKHKDTARICREKIRNAKTQLELNLATAVKDKTSFYKYTCNKRRAKENLHPLLDVVGNVTTKDEEKADIQCLFTLVFNSQESSRPLSWKQELEWRAE